MRKFVMHVQNDVIKTNFWKPTVFCISVTMTVEQAMERTYVSGRKRSGRQKQVKKIEMLD